jgi:ParB family transcriptional regulator, chromosome partitioning protein
MKKLFLSAAVITATVFSAVAQEATPQTRPQSPAPNERTAKEDKATGLEKADQMTEDKPGKGNESVNKNAAKKAAKKKNGKKGGKSKAKSDKTRTGQTPEGDVKQGPSTDTPVKPGKTPKAEKAPKAPKTEKAPKAPKAPKEQETPAPSGKQ